MKDNYQPGRKKSSEVPNRDEVFGSGSQNKLLTGFGAVIRLGKRRAGMWQSQIPIS